MIKKIGVSLLLLFCIVMVLPFGVFAEGSDVIKNNMDGIPDPYLYKAILQEMGKRPNDTFTRQEAQNVMELDLDDLDWTMRVTSIAGIGILSNLEFLNIRKCHWMTDIQGIETLGKLKHLELSDSWIARIKNLELLAELKSLEELKMEIWSLDNLQFLAGLENLKSLEVLDSHLKSLQGIENLSRMERLDVSGNELTSIREVKNLRRLRTLSVARNRLSSLDGLEGLKKLERLNVDDNRLKSLKGAENLVKLKELSACENKLKDISYIADLFNMTSIKVRSNRIKKLPDLKGFWKLLFMQCDFTDNLLSKKELKKKLPERFLKRYSEPYLEGEYIPDQQWIDDQMRYQNLNRSVQITTKKINRFTYTLEGRIFIKDAQVGLYRIKDGDRMGDAKTKKNGKFSMFVPLKRWRGDEVGILIFLHLKSQNRYVPIKSTTRFKVSAK